MPPARSRRSTGCHTPPSPPRPPAATPLPQRCNLPPLVRAARPVGSRCLGGHASITSPALGVRLVRPSALAAFTALGLRAAERGAEVASGATARGRPEHSSTRLRSAVVAALGETLPNLIETQWRDPSCAAPRAALAAAVEREGGGVTPRMCLIYPSPFSAQGGRGVDPVLVCARAASCRGEGRGAICRVRACVCVFLCMCARIIAVTGLTTTRTHARLRCPTVVGALCPVRLVRDSSIRILPAHRASAGGRAGRLRRRCCVLL